MTDLTDRDIEQISTLIRESHATAIKHAGRAVQKAAQTGWLLNKIRARLPGTYMSWVSANCDFSYDQAERYSKVFNAVYTLADQKLKSVMVGSAFAEWNSQIADGVERLVYGRTAAELLRLPKPSKGSQGPGTDESTEPTTNESGEVPDQPESEKTTEAYQKGETSSPQPDPNFVPFQNGNLRFLLPRHVHAWFVKREGIRAIIQEAQGLRRAFDKFYFVPCTKCNGAGEKNEEPCTRCAGTGKHKKPIAAHVHYNRANAALKEFIEDLKGAEPYGLCPYCQGIDKRCSPCDGMGWLPRQLYKAAPEELRNAVEAPK